MQASTFILQHLSFTVPAFHSKFKIYKLALFHLSSNIQHSTFHCPSFIYHQTFNIQHFIASHSKFKIQNSKFRRVYSLRKLVTGFAMEARTERYPTVISAMRKVHPIEARKIQTPMSILYV